MTDEDDVRRMLHATDSPPNTLDAAAIVRRSRARRLPRQIAAGGVSALALAGVAVLSVQTLAVQPGAPTSMSAGSAAEQSDAAPETFAIKRAPAEKVNLCTGALAEVAGSAYGLRLDVVAPTTASVGSQPVPVTVRLTNTSDREVVGSTAASPAITLSQDGIVLWHSNGPAIMSLVTVELSPGESLDYSAEVTPVRCGVDDDLAESFRTDLPAVEPGTYALSALIDFTPDPSMGSPTTELDLVAGPLAPLTLD